MEDPTPSRRRDRQAAQPGTAAPFALSGEPPAAATPSSEPRWPAILALPDEAAWEAAQRRLWDALAVLEAYIEVNSLDALAGSPYGLGDLFCRFIHNAYHIGQITKLRELRAALDAAA